MRSADMTRSIFAGTIAEMTYPEVESAAGRDATMLVPIGVIEEHGPHLPLGTDVYAAHTLCRLVKRHGAELGVEILIAPPFFWGVNHVTAAFPGTFRTRTEVAAGLLEDILGTLVDDGFARIFVINHHGDLAHNRMVREVLHDQHQRGRRDIRWLEERDMVERLGDDGTESIWATYERSPEADSLRRSEALGVHAHELETAVIARYFPELVDFDILDALEPTSLDHGDLVAWRQGGERARSLTPRGYFGAPQPVDPDLWRHYDFTARAMAQTIQDLAPVEAR